jgi:hypothetical protein
VTGGARSATAMAKRAVAARSSGGGGLAFGRRKEKREQASAGLKGGGGPVGLLRPIGQQGRRVMLGRMETGPGR